VREHAGPAGHLVGASRTDARRDVPGDAGFARAGEGQAARRQVFTGSGDEEIRFHNGSRILFGARERGFGRGIPGVDILIFDEAQILSDRALSNMLATMNTSRFGLQLYIGTPPKPEDMSRRSRGCARRRSTGRCRMARGSSSAPTRTRRRMTAASGVGRTRHTRSARRRSRKRRGR
jgi:hypothetical protein